MVPFSCDDITASSDPRRLWEKAPGIGLLSTSVFTVEQPCGAALLMCMLHAYCSCVCADNGVLSIVSVNDFEFVLDFYDRYTSVYGCVRFFHHTRPVTNLTYPDKSTGRRAANHACPHQCPLFHWSSNKIKYYRYQLQTSGFGLFCNPMQIHRITHTLK